MEKEKSRSLDEILQSLETGIREFMTTDRYQNYLRAVGSFHSYSTNNILLIATQCPGATLVAGYSTWKKMDRYVKRGEHGIRIIAPVPVKVEKEQEKVDRFGNVKKETVTVTIPRFRAVTVFDVSQTEGEPLPSITPRELDEPVKDYPNFLRALLKASRVPVSFRDIEGGPKGSYDRNLDAITVQKGMGETQTVKTLVHEMAHSFLHSRESGRTDLDAATKEVEAESAAFAVCSHFGVDTSEYSFPYVSGWSCGKDIQTLRDSLDSIREVASQMIHRIEYSYESIQLENALPNLARELAAVSRDAGIGLELDRANVWEDALRQGKAGEILKGLRTAADRETDEMRKEILSGLLRKVEEYLPDRDRIPKEIGGRER